MAKLRKNAFFEKKIEKCFGVIKKSSTFALAIKPERVADSKKGLVPSSIG